MAKESPHDNSLTVAATVAVRDLVFTVSDFYRHSISGIDI